MITQTIKVSETLDEKRGLQRRNAGSVSFDEAVEGADRVTVAVTVWALLELYKRGDATWEQSEPFGPITVHAA
jgi:segregation and condensation protein A